MDEGRGLWRGKRLDNKEWVMGYYVRCMPDNGEFIHYIIELDAHCNIVDYETLGEFTGLCDKNGEPIFEGDIIKTKKYGKVVGDSNVNDYDIFVVKYEPAAFRLKNRNRGFNLVDDGYSKFEVIGNIHDSPELLKGVGDDERD